MSRAARRPPRRCSTACCCCSGRSAAPARSSGRRMAQTIEELRAHVTAGLGPATTSAVQLDELTLEVPRDDIVGVLTFLRDDACSLFEILIDICGVDWPSREQRFDVVYHLLSPQLNQRIRVKLRTDEASAVPSVVEVYPAANWFEREA